jgi:hypothetical protein
MPNNPFTYGNPISDPARFIGRQREVEQVFSRLLNAEAESSSLVGERRIGKSSLLKYLMHPNTHKLFGIDPNIFIFIYADLQIVDNNTTPTRLWQRLLRESAAQCPNEEMKTFLNEARKEEVIDNFTLADLFDNVDMLNIHLVFLLDEFEKVTSNPNFGPDFFYGLRSLAIQHNLSLITSSRSELIDLTHSEVIRSSPFFNIFANINLRTFSTQEARKLVETSLEGTGIEFSHGEYGYLAEIAGTHPYFLQAACHFLFEAYCQGLGPAERKKFLLKEFREEAEPHLADYWHNSLDNERILLTAMALLEREGKAGKHSFGLQRLRELYSRSDQTIGKLEKRGLLVEEGDGYTLFNALFGEWIVSEIANTMNDSTSYDEWLHENQGALEKFESKTKKEIADILPKIGVQYRDLVIHWASDPRNILNTVLLFKNVLGV